MKKSKVRNLTKTLAVVSLLAPVGGYALGIGDIKLNSALNQNLDAEIALTLSGENVSDIKVSLASPEKFSQAGVSWNYFLSKIKFEAVAQANGKAVIKLTSREALKEPFLDFLLEVSWPKGNLYREFTVLVDPPAAYNPGTVPAATTAENYQQPSNMLPQSRQSHANSQANNGEYGPTLANDTLWSIAERVRGQNDVSVEQMILALYEANPQAFYKANVYALTSGIMLKIPDREAVLKLSRAQALAEFNRHTSAWKNHNASVRAEAPAKEKPAQGGAGKAADNQLTLLAPSKSTVTDNAVVAPANEQAAAGKKAGDAAKKGKAQVVPGQAEGVSAAASPDMAAIQSKVAELEKQLAMMQELVALKDQQLAALQNQAQANSAAQNHAAPNADTKPADQVVPEKPADQTTPIAQPVASAQPIEQAKSVDQMQPPIESAQPVKPAEPPKPAEPVKSVEPVQQAKPVVPVQPAQPVAQPVPQSDDLYYWTVGGVGTAVLSLLGGLWWRKRKVEEETNTESMFATTMINIPSADDNLSVPVVDNNVAVQDVKMIDESSFLSEFTPSDFDSFDTDQGEIDPISEADVYLAYGRYQQAEELIRQAIKDQPNRDECKLKLLEIFYANENKEAFEAYANELIEAGKRNETEFWEKAAEMGREICPESALFSSEANFSAVDDESASDTGVEHVIVDNGDNNVNVETAFAAGERDAEFLTEEAVEPNDETLVLSASEPETGSLASEQANIVDFDLSVFSSDTDEPDDTANEAAASVSTESLDFNLSAFPEPPVESDESAAASLQAEDLDFDLGAFSLDNKEADEPASIQFGSIDVDLNPPSIDIQESTDEEQTATGGIEFDLSAFALDDNKSDVPEHKDVAASASAIESIDFDLGAFSLDDVKQDNKVALSDSIESIDFDLEGFSFGAKDSADKDKKAAASDSIEQIDFDLSSFSLDAEKPEKSITALDLIEDIDLSSFSMDTQLSDGTPDAQESNKKQAFESLDFDFDLGDSGHQAVQPLDSSNLSAEAKKDYENFDFSGDSALDFGGDFDFSFDLDIPDLDSGSDSGEHGEFGVSDLTDMDELETKLDLAKAYVDMGDAEAAKDIAKEVLEQGSDEQKKVAQALLDELG